MKTARQRSAVWWWGALAAGVTLFAITLYFTDFAFLISAGPRAALATALAIAASGAWHFARTWAWSRSFAHRGRVRFARLARVRIAAEAFSYLTLRGIAGEPLKVLLLGREVDAREATAAVALERLAFMIGTLIIVGIGSLVALETQTLSAVWFKVFAGFATGAGAITLGVVVVVIGKGTYFVAGLTRMDRAFGTRLGAGRVARFAGDVEAQLLDAVRRNPARLAALMGSTLAAYLCMCAEVWLVLWAIGIDISFSGAMAIETFSRVVSFATVFIPANLGGLEASSIAAAAAVGASGAGAPLAFARRIRGLVWTGVGLALYPRPRAAAVTSGATLLYVPRDQAVAISPFARLAGLAIAERAFRAAFRAGYARVVVLVDDDIAPRLQRIASGVAGDVRLVRAHEWRDAVAALPADEPVAALGAGSIVAPAILADAAARPAAPGVAMDVAAGDAWPISGLLRVTRDEAAHLAALTAALHARIVDAAPRPSGDDVSWGRARLALRARNEAELAEAERSIRASVIKPTDNKVARWNRGISLPVSIALIRTPLTANQFSIALVAVGLYSGWLYSLGTYGSMVLASILGLAASVADGCDGEIARLKYQESALGCWIETVGDYSYYIAIFIGMSVGVARWTHVPVFFWIGMVAIAGTLVTFALLIYLRSAITAGQPDKLHAIGKERFNADPSFWTRAVWSVSLVATRSFMPYFILALAILGLMPLIVLLAAVGANIYWMSLVAKMRALMGGGAADQAAA